MLYFTIHNIILQSLIRMRSSCSVVENMLDYQFRDRKINSSLLRSLDETLNLGPVPI